MASNGKSTLKPGKPANSSATKMAKNAKNGNFWLAEAKPKANRQ